MIIERDIIKGRIDISADNGEQKIIIENKIYSGLNGIKISQLSTYYEWGKKLNLFLAVLLPAQTSKRTKIIQEIKDKDDSMKDHYIIVTYSEIAEFINNHKKELGQNYIFENYVEDFYGIFKNFGYSNKFEFFRYMFLETIKNNSTNK